MGISEQEFAILRQNQALANPAMAPKKKRRAVTSEAEIQRDCTQILMHDGWRSLRTDPVSDRKRGKGFGEIGMADYLYIRYCPPIAASYTGYKADALVLWIEWKKDGGKPSNEQAWWHAEERAKGALTLIAGVDFDASVAGFMEWYGQSGLKRGLLASEARS